MADGVIGLGGGVTRTDQGMADLTLLQVNDLHGYLAPHPELFNLAAGGSFRSGGGLARIAGLFSSVRTEMRGAVVALDNGDTFHGSMPAVQTKGEALLGPMARLGLDAMTAHWEFAYGLEHVGALAARLPYPILAANIENTPNGLPLPPFIVLERAGMRIGVIGLAAVGSPQLLPAEDRERLRIGIGDRAVERLVHVLRRDHGVDLVVVLSHLGFAQDCKLASVVSGIDVILSGHTHNRLERPALFNDTLIMQSGAHGSFIGRLDLEVTGSGVSGWHHALVAVDETMEEDGDMRGLVDDALAPFADAGARVIGHTRTTLTRYTMLESTMDNLLLDAVAAAAGTPGALSNGWRYGAPIPAGPITELDAWNIVPANPAVSVVTLTGGELRRLYEDNLEATFSCDPWQQRGGYVKRCRGLQLVVKLENPSGHRIQELRFDGDPVRSDASYTVAFLGEQAVPAGYGSGRHSIGLTAVDALRGYLSDRDVVEPALTGSVTLV